MKSSLKRRVRQRANGTCEYCRMASRFYRAPFQIDHVIAEQHGGRTVFSNLALACYHCNLKKGPNIAGKDPATKRTTRLFHPRHDRWEDHFRWRGAKLLGRTSIGRATIHVLEINDMAYLLVRTALLDAGLFP
jgi:5-methylcytosine-specific restriction endonuclease McrA